MRLGSTTGHGAGDQAPPRLKSRPRLPPRLPPGRPPIRRLLLRPNSSWSLDTAKWGTALPTPDRAVGPSRPPNFGPAAARAALPAPWAELSLLRRDKSALAPGPRRNFPPRPYRRRRDPASPGPARALGERPRFPPGKLRRTPRGLRSLTRQRVPEASATDRVPRRRLAPTEVGGRSGRACATAPGSGGRGDLRPRLEGGGGARAPAAIPSPPHVHPRLSHSPARSRTLGALTSLARPGPAQQSAPRPQLVDGVLAGATGGAARAGQGRAAPWRSAQCRRRCAAERGAPGTAPPPSPTGCRGGAQRQPGLPGSPQRCDGVSAARAQGVGPSALIRQGRALAPDSPSA